MKSKNIKFNKGISQLLVSVPFNVVWIVSDKREVVIATDNPEIFDYIEVKEKRKQLEITASGYFTTTNGAINIGGNNIVVGNNNVNVGGDVIGNINVGANNTGNIAGGNISIKQNYGTVAKTITNHVSGDVFIKNQKFGKPSKLISSQATSIIVYAPSFGDIDLGGVGKLVATGVEQDQLNVTVSGAGNIKLDGSVSDFSAKVSGAGDIKAKKLKTKTAKLAVSGAGNIKANVSETLNATVSGAGDIRVYGNPNTVKKHIAGAGSIKLKGGKSC